MLTCRVFAEIVTTYICITHGYFTRQYALSVSIRLCQFWRTETSWLMQIVRGLCHALCFSRCNAPLYNHMDFLPGGDLFSIIENESSLDQTGVKFYMAKVALGLNDLHQIGYVHRDLKPDNVLIAHNGHTKLVDFKVAA